MIIALAIVFVIILVSATAGWSYYYIKSNEVNNTPLPLPPAPPTPITPTPQPVPPVVCPPIALLDGKINQVNPRWEGNDKYVDAVLECPVGTGNQYGSIYDSLYSTTYKVANPGCATNIYEVNNSSVNVLNPPGGLPSNYVGSSCGTIVGKIKVGTVLAADPANPGTCAPITTSFMSTVNPLTYDCGKYVNMNQCKSTGQCIWTPQNVVYENTNVVYSPTQLWPNIGSTTISGEKTYDCHNLEKEAADYLKASGGVPYPGTLRPYPWSSYSTYFRDNGTGIKCGMDFTGAPSKFYVSFLPSAADGYKYKAVAATTTAGVNPDWLTLLKQYAPTLV